MSNVDLQKSPVEGFSAGLVDDNIYEVTFYSLYLLFYYFVYHRSQMLSNLPFFFSFVVGNPRNGISRHLVVKYPIFWSDSSNAFALVERTLNLHVFFFSILRSEGGFFKAKLSFPRVSLYFLNFGILVYWFAFAFQSYPIDPPTMTFLTEMYHPNGN